MALTAAPPATAVTRLDPTTARMTAVLYAGVALTALLGFLVVGPQLFDPDSPTATAAALVAHEPLARLGLALELGLVVTQVLTALWFYRLFAPTDPFSARAIAIFGTVNSVAVLVSAACLATAIDLALDPIVPAGSQLMYLLSGNLWGVAGLFFGLWLVPMGLAARRSRQAPGPLGGLLVAGGVGYVLSAFATYLVADLPAAVPAALVLPATIGEFWMIGWLLLLGLRKR